MTRLRVGLNLVFLGEQSGGIGRFATELTGALAVRDDVELHVFTSRDEPVVLRSQPWAEQVRWTQFPVRTSGLPLHLVAGFGALPALAMARRLDILHSPANAGPVRVPGVRCVITAHDAIWLQAGNDWESPRAVARMWRLAVPTQRRADRLTTGAEASRKALVELLGLDPKRIDVTPYGVRSPAPEARFTPEPELRERCGLGTRRIVLCVAQKRPYKNHDKLVRALPLLPSDVVLVMPGAPTPFEWELRHLAGELGCAERVKLPGWLPDEDLEGLYRLAACVALPSRLEGFGLPALEAMVRGVPLVASTESALPEVVGDAGLLVDPTDVAGLAAAVQRLLEDHGLATELAAAGRVRAAHYTWERTAELTVRAYERALAEPRARHK